VRDTALIANKKEIEFSKATLRGVFKTNSTFNTAIPGQKGYKPVQKTDTMEEYREFLWLFKG
jgi:hypothetical protein